MIEDFSTQFNPLYLLMKYLAIIFRHPVYKIIHYYEQFFYIFPNLFFSKTNNAKIIPLTIFYYVFTLLLLFLLH